MARLTNEALFRENCSLSEEVGRLRGFNQTMVGENEVLRRRVTELEALLESLKNDLAEAEKKAADDARSAREHQSDQRREFMEKESRLLAQVHESSNELHRANQDLRVVEEGYQRIIGFCARNLEEE